MNRTHSVEILFRGPSKRESNSSPESTGWGKKAKKQCLPCSPKENWRSGSKNWKLTGFYLSAQEGKIVQTFARLSGAWENPQWMHAVRLHVSAFGEDCMFLTILG